MPQVGGLQCYGARHPLLAWPCGYCGAAPRCLARGRRHRFRPVILPRLFIYRSLAGNPATSAAAAAVAASVVPTTACPGASEPPLDSLALNASWAAGRLLIYAVNKVPYRVTPVLPSGCFNPRRAAWSRTPSAAHGPWGRGPGQSTGRAVSTPHLRVHLTMYTGRLDDVACGFGAIAAEFNACYCSVD